MAKPHFVAGVDVGSTKVCAIAAEVGADAQVHFLAASNVPARGVQKGAVVDLDAAASVVSTAVDRLGVAVRRKIDRVYLATSTAVASLNARGTAVPSVPNRPLTVEDIGRAVHAATDVGLPMSRQILHALPRSFVIDGQAGIGNPVGLFGRRVDAEVHVVTAGGPAILGLVACLERCGLEVEQVVSQPLASAEAALSAKERELGVVVADIGGNCGLSVFVDGAPWHTATLQVGGRHIPQDVATVLGIANDAAEELTLSAGHAIPAAVDPAEILDVPMVDGGATARVARVDLCRIIEARVLEIIGLIGEEIQRSGYRGLLPAGLVLTGGTARLPGIARLATEVLQIRVRIGQPSVPDALGLSGPAYASPVGLIHWAARGASGRWLSYPTRPGLSGGTGGATKAAPRWWRGLWSPAIGGDRSGRG